MKINFEGSKQQIFTCFKTVLNPHRIRIPMCFKIWIRIKFKYLCTSKPRFHYYQLKYQVTHLPGSRPTQSREPGPPAPAREHRALAMDRHGPGLPIQQGRPLHGAGPLVYQDLGELHTL